MGSTLIIGRIARQGQRGLPKAFIIADPAFRGDKMAFQVKNERITQEREMTEKFRPDDLQTFEKVEMLQLDEEQWEALRRQPGNGMIGQFKGTEMDPVLVD